MRNVNAIWISAENVVYLYSEEERARKHWTLSSFLAKKLMISTSEIENFTSEIKIFSGSSGFFSGLVGARSGFPEKFSGSKL